MKGISQSSLREKREERNDEESVKPKKDKLMKLKNRSYITPVEYDKMERIAGDLLGRVRSQEEDTGYDLVRACTPETRQWVKEWDSGAEAREIEASKRKHKITVAAKAKLSPEEIEVLGL